MAMVHTRAQLKTMVSADGVSQHGVRQKHSALIGVNPRQILCNVCIDEK